MEYCGGDKRPDPTDQGLEATMYQVVVTSVDHVLYEGTKEECELILHAFIKYNGAKNIEIQEID